MTGTTPAAGPRRQRQPPEVRRQMLIESARGVIAERGLHATTVRDVAAAGGVAVGTVTYHFSGMAEVLAGVIDAEMRSYSGPFMTAARDAVTGRDALAHIVSGLLADGDAARDHWKLWLDFWALSAHQDAYSARQSAIYAELHELVRDSFVRGAQDGTLLVGPAGTRDPQEAALAFVALLDGLVVQCYLPHGALTPEQGRALLTASLPATG